MKRVYQQDKKSKTNLFLRDIYCIFLMWSALERVWCDTKEKKRAFEMNASCAHTSYTKKSVRGGKIVTLIG